jgi:isoquinoline 1-oxidoreductase beta subunit
MDPRGRHPGWHRPAYVRKLEAGLDAQGKLVGWRHRIVGQSIMAGTPFAQTMVKDGVDGTSVEGAANLPYAIPNLGVQLTTVESPVSVLWWRVVGSSHTAYAVEAFIDEVAEAAGQDPYRFRRALLAYQPRHRAVLDLAAEKAGWGQPLPKGRAAASPSPRPSTRMSPRSPR